MRIFLDANILFSAAGSDGAVRMFLGLLRESGHILCADAFVIEEARRNLADKSAAALPDLESLLAGIELLPTHPPDLSLLASLPLPVKDQPVLAAAIRGGCEILITGDRRHFGLLFGESVQGVMVHHPSGAAEALL